MAVRDDAEHLPGDGRAHPALDDLAELTALLSCVDLADVKNCAAALLREFGRLGAVIAGEPERLSRFAEPRAVELLTATRRIVLATLRPNAHPIEPPSITRTSSVLAYLRAAIGHAAVEELRVLYLDPQLTLIRDELVARGSRRDVALDVREIVRRALDLRAEALLLAHNHPGGSVQPSRADIAATLRLESAAAFFEIKLVDHVVVTDQHATSLRAEGLI